MIESSYAKFSASAIHIQCLVRLGEIQRFRQSVRDIEIRRVVNVRVKHNGKPLGLFERIFGFIYERKILSTDPGDVAADLDSYGGLKWIDRVYDFSEGSVRRVIQLCSVMPSDDIYLCDAHVSAIYSQLE